MVLHAMGEFKSTLGHTEESWHTSHQTALKLLKGLPGEADEQAKTWAGEDKVKVKVIELAEV
jgi:hypothetical protein